MTIPLSPCGIDCQICDAFKATNTNDQDLFKKLQDNYKQQFNKDIAIEDLACDGCSSVGIHISFCAVCEIRVCAISKGYATCAECSDFPCTKGSFIWTSNSVSKANLEALRKD
ncbi:MAG: DUF3795 domain-containing protein [Candidatus Cloacimonetes bacterium]|nr:DUF3795 domain-containing protein [Candidatus Cloacimonadota bacterium]MDD2507164.1 DUF3795 domain-containing protein [Candidatus Cloacimonadota bacterium]MDD4560588.1 DUF3795 domain-containing protein [Candidatus Cloacimonadota bacterium]